MRRWMLIGLVALAGILGAVWATAAGAAKQVATHKATTVTPTRGTRHTTFTVTYRVPADASGTSLARRYAVAVAGPAGSGCGSVGGATAARGSTAARERFKLRPPSRGWCAGSYRGHIELVETPICGPARACPMFVAILTVGRFSFQVK